MFHCCNIFIHAYCCASRISYIFLPLPPSPLLLMSDLIRRLVSLVCRDPPKEAMFSTIIIPFIQTKEHVILTLLPQNQVRRKSGLPDVLMGSARAWRAQLFRILPISAKWHPRAFERNPQAGIVEAKGEALKSAGSGIERVEGEALKSIE